MDNKEALRILFDCSKLYKENLEGRNLLILSLRDKTKFCFIEAVFKKSYFQHLTGIITDEKKIDSTLFYKQCLNKRLSIKDIKFKSDGTTSLKLSVLPRLMNLYQNSKIIGDFNHSKPVLYADKIAGSTMACMGFKKTDKFYVPVTILKEDIRDIINNQEKVLAIFTKKVNDKLYNELKYQAKDIENYNLKNMSEEFLEKLDFINMNSKFNSNLIKLLHINIKKKQEVEGVTLK